MHKLAIYLAALIGLVIVFRTAPATAMIVPGQVDNFENGSLQSWEAGGFTNPNPPRNIATGGPAGADDNFLQLTSNGSFGAGGKLVVFNSNQWAGDYLGANIASIDMQVNNLGSTNLVLRLILNDFAHGQSLTTSDPVNVAAASGWRMVSFPLNPMNMTGGTYNTVMQSVGELNLVHSPSVIRSRNLAPNIAAQLGVDNITAVPGESPIATWKVDANGNWSQASNWTGAVPNGVDIQAVVGGVITAPRTVTVDIPITVGRLDFDNANAYTVAGTNALRLEVTMGEAQINVMSGSHTISAPVTVADNTLVTITPAASNLTLSGAVTATGVTLTKAGAGTLTVNQLRGGGLSINSGKVVVAQDGTPDTAVVSALTIAGGATPTTTFDLTNNPAVINYTGASPVGTVRSQLLAGRGGPGLGAGAWTGMGVTSSAAAAANAVDAESRSLGYAENAALPLGPFTNFRGQAVDDTSVLIAFTRTGDATLDGVVNDDDVTIIGATYAPGVPQPDWSFGDFDYNGFVDDDDVTLLGVFYDPAAPPVLAPPEASLASVAAVPEPTTLALVGVLLAACGIGAVRRGAARLVPGAR